MAEPVITSLVPVGGPGTAAGTPRNLPGSAGAAAGQLPGIAGGGVLSCGMGRIDSSGRVAEWMLSAGLGWKPGDRLSITAAAGSVVVRRDAAGGP